MRRILLSFAILFTSVAWAQPSAIGCKVPGPTEVLADPEAQLVLLTKTCLGTATDQDALVKGVDEVMKKPQVVSTTERLRQAVNLLLQHPGYAGDEAAAWSAVKSELVRAKSALSSLNGDEGGSVWNTTVEQALSVVWKQPMAGNPIRLGGVSYDLLKPPKACVAQQPCPDFAARADLLRVINVVANLQSMALRPTLQAAYEDASLQLKRWQAYRQEGHPLYFYEVAVNGALMKTNLLGKPCQDREFDRVRRGFCEVPTRQLILLHPEGGLRFSRSATKKEELKPALVIQVLGFYQWNWAIDGNKETATPVNRMGASLAATYTNQDVTSKEGRWGYGPMFHWNDYSLAVTKASGGQWSVVLNIPLAGTYYGRRQQMVDELAKLK